MPPPAARPRSGGDVLGTGRDDTRALLEVERSGAERLLDVEQVDREPQLAAEKLRRGDIDRARRLERAHRVDPTGGEMAEREGERAHDPQPVGEVPTFGASLATSDVRVASKERISTSSFGRTAPSG